MGPILPTAQVIHWGIYNDLQLGRNASLKTLLVCQSIGKCLEMATTCYCYIFMATRSLPHWPNTYRVDNDIMTLLTKPKPTYSVGSSCCRPDIQCWFAKFNCEIPKFKILFSLLTYKFDWLCRCPVLQVRVTRDTFRMHGRLKKSMAERSWNLKNVKLPKEDKLLCWLGRTLCSSAVVLLPYVTPFTSVHVSSIVSCHTDTIRVWLASPIQYCSSSSSPQDVGQTYCRISQMEELNLPSTTNKHK